MRSPFIFRCCSMTLACLLAIGSLTGCQQENKNAAAAQAPLKVLVTQVHPSDEIMWSEQLGETEGREQAQVRAQVSGTLEKIVYEEGERVKAGQVLFVIDDAPYRAALNSASAAVHQLKAEYEQDQREAVRYTNLFAAKAVSQKVRDDARSEAAITKAKLAIARANEESARINLSRTRVKAPSDGIAGRALVNKGALVTAASTLLAELTQPDHLRLVFHISESDLDGARITPDSRIRVYDRHRNEYPAKLDYIAKSIDPSTSTLELRARVDGKGVLRPGQFLRAQLALRTLNGVFRIPQKAVYQKPDGTYQVYVEEDGRAKPVAVKVGSWKDTDWIVLSGLKDGDRVCINQIQRLKPGLALAPALADAPRK
ncbi:MAG TPA: efflux RND transporter periplasmic adaptor subunit [Sutterella sp.]|nr:efflux RND transporter periplasmic adaptor subunit [Sutterella sp.]